MADPMQPDDIDWRIIDILRDEYLPNNAVARRLGVSEGTVRKRIQKLKDAGILRIRALIDPDVLADQQLAMVAVNVAVVPEFAGSNLGVPAPAARRLLEESR